MLHLTFAQTRTRNTDSRSLHGRPSERWNATTGSRQSRAPTRCGRYLRTRPSTSTSPACCFTWKVQSLIASCVTNNYRLYRCSQRRLYARRAVVVARIRCTHIQPSIHPRLAARAAKETIRKHDAPVRCFHSRAHQLAYDLFFVRIEKGSGRNVLRSVAKSIPNRSCTPQVCGCFFIIIIIILLFLTACRCGRKFTALLQFISDVTEYRLGTDAEALECIEATYLKPSTVLILLENDRVTLHSPHGTRV